MTYTIQDAAYLLEVSPATVWKYARIIGVQRHGCGYVIHKKDIAKIKAQIKPVGRPRGKHD